MEMNEITLMRLRLQAGARGSNEKRLNTITLFQCDSLLSLRENHSRKRNRISKLSLILL